MRVVSRWCRCIVQRLCATDSKRPCLVRAAAPHSAPARTPGVYAQRLCTDAEPTKHTQPFTDGEGVWGFGKDAEIERPKALQDAKPTKRSYRDREFALFLIKTDFFYKLRQCRLALPFCFYNNKHKVKNQFTAPS